MEFNTELLTLFKRIGQNYQSRLNGIAKHHDLTSLEATVISFLHCNPGEDSVSAIVDLLSLSKGDVSMAVDHLVSLGYLEKKKDEEDRRKSHLILRPSAQTISQEIDGMREKYLQEILSGFSKEEARQFKAYIERAFHNVGAE